MAKFTSDAYANRKVLTFGLVVRGLELFDTQYFQFCI